MGVCLAYFPGHPALPGPGKILEALTFFFWSPLTTVLPGTSQFMKPVHIPPHDTPQAPYELGIILILQEGKGRQEEGDTWLKEM